MRLKAAFAASAVAAALATVPAAIGLSSNPRGPQWRMRRPAWTRPRATHSTTTRARRSWDTPTGVGRNTTPAPSSSGTARPEPMRRARMVRVSGVFLTRPTAGLRTR